MTTAVAAKPSITAIILSFNEELHIARCIERLWPVVERIVVIDSFSTDRTVEIARSLGAEVLQNPFRSHADQFNWGLAHAGVTSDWTMKIDCDEYLEPAACEEIVERIGTLSDEVTAIEFRRKVYFRERFIRWGGYYDTVLTRLWRTGQGFVEHRWMDEAVVVMRGQKLRLSRGDLVDHNLNDITYWIAKHNSYTTKQMIDFINLKYGVFEMDDRLMQSTTMSSKLKRFLRNGVYARFPLYLRATLYFVQRYFFRFGFLDGRQGFVFHFMQGWWNMMLIDAKIDEAETIIARHGIEAFKSHVAHRFGLSDLSPVDSA